MGQGREYKFDYGIEHLSSFGFGLAIGNTQPKSEYKTASWEINLLFLCWIFSLSLSYNYKNNP